MSIIDKLHILGIRNFGPEEKDKAVIKFSTPLTLILGRNGCGKTTIIEALKYATCGEIPAGCDSGSGFVHDPELVNASVVRGQVKLRCWNPSGNPSTVVRTVQVTRKVKKLEFKTLDTTFTSGDQKHSLSERCVDIDETMCEHLGVSKAVLTNVIFCHQEDSAWPLDKGKKIKERFDAIFGITEYNKCLDHLRALTKVYVNELSILKQKCQFLGDYRSAAEEKRKKLSEDKAKLTAINDQVEELHKKKEPIEVKIKDLLQKQQNYVKYAAKVENMKNRKKLIVEQINGFKQDIDEEYQGSKEELLCEIASFDEDLRNRKNRLKNLADEKQTALIEEKRIQDNISLKQTRLGNLQSTEQANNDNINRRNQNLKTLAEELGTPVMTSSQINEATGGEPVKIVERKVREIASEVEKLQEDQESLERSFQKKIDEAFEKKARLETDVKTKARVINEAKEKIRSIKREIDEVNRTSEGVGDLAKKSEALTKEKENTINSFDDGQCKNEIEQAGNEIKTLERQSSVLYDEIKILQKVSVQREKLDALNKRKNDREAELNKMKQKHNSSLEHLLSFVPSHDFRSALEKQLKKVSDEIKRIEKSINEKENKLTSLDTRKSNLDEQLKQKRRKCAEVETEIDHVCRNKSIEEVVESLNADIADNQQTIALTNASRFLYQKYIDKLKSADPVCPVCNRDFSDPSEMEPVIQDLTNRIKDSPRQEKDAEDMLVSLTPRQAAAVELQHKHKAMMVVKNEEIPKLNADIKSIKETIETTRSELEALRLELLSPQSDQTLIEGLLSDATLMDQCQKELRNLESEIKVAESSLPSSIPSKTLEDANQELDDIQSKLSKLRKTQDENQKKLSKHNETMKKINDELNAIAKKQLEIAGSIQKRKSLEERLKELENTETEATAEKSRAEMQLNPVENEYKEHKEKLSKVRMDHKRILAEKKKKLTEYEKKVDEVRKLQAAIDEYTRNGGSGQLQTVRSKLAELQILKKDMESRKEELEKERENTAEFLNKQEIKKFNLDTALKLLNKKEELVKVEKEIDELEGDTKITDANQLQKDLQRLDKERREIEMQISNASGRVSVMQSTVSELERELKQDKFKDAEDNYRQSYVELTIKEKAVEDIKEYEKGMDWVMIHFHKDRMKRINEVIRELWRSIYRGNDIDYVEIKTEEGATTATGKRNYNYRVVQVKNNVELEMPGRCSAGQKVLACLIIRIALAETFSKNCGVLALDEPTTNLDKVNSESLAGALAEIVERRSTQRNFQLIVITHDKEFIDKLCQIEKVEHYIEVVRNDRGKSQAIKREV